MTFHGLTIDVPTTWGLNATRCGQPIRDTVVLPGAVPLCGIAHPPAVSSAEFVEGAQPGLAGTLVDARTSTFELDGHHATRLDGRRDSLTVVAIAVPAVSAQVVISSPRPAVAQSVAASAAITDRNSDGCPARSAFMDGLPTGQPPRRPGAADTLIPGTPRRITVCRYLAALVEQSTRLDARRLTPFLAALNGAPAGVSRADPKAYLPEICRRAATSPGSVSGITSSDSESYLVTAHYGSGPDVVVVARLGQCDDLGASNGTRTAQRTDAMTEQLIAAAGESVGYPGSVRPA